jgi:hypothetical protein
MKATWSVESQTSFVVGHELLYVETTLEDMWGTLPSYLLDHFPTLGAVPSQVRVQTTLLEQLLQPLAEELGFRLIRSRSLRHVNRVKHELFDRFL